MNAIREHRQMWRERIGIEPTWDSRPTMVLKTRASTRNASAPTAFIAISWEISPSRQTPDSQQAAQEGQPEAEHAGFALAVAPGCVADADFLDARAFVGRVCEQFGLHVEELGGGLCIGKQRSSIEPET